MWDEDVVHLSVLNNFSFYDRTHNHLATDILISHYSQNLNKRWDLYVIFNTLTKKKILCHYIIFSIIQVNEIYSILKLYLDVPYQLSNVKEPIATYEVMICLFV